MAASGDRVCLGVVVAAHGVKGWVKIKPFTETPEAVAAYGPLSSEDGARRFTIVAARPAGQALLAKFDGVDDRAAADALKRTALYVARATLPALEEAETWYHADLIGLDVVTGAGRRLGRVNAIYDFGAGDLLEIARDDGGSELVPFTRANVPQVDVAGGRLVIDPPHGLFDDGVEPEAEGP